MIVPGPELMGRQVHNRSALKPNDRLQRDATAATPLLRLRCKPMLGVIVSTHTSTYLLQIATKRAPVS